MSEAPGRVTRAIRYTDLGSNPGQKGCTKEGQVLTTAPPEWLLVHASRLFDGTGAPPVNDPTVVVHGGVIQGVYAGRLPQGGWPPDAPLVDLPGHTLLPGLIDAHVHLVLPGDGTPFEATVRESDEVLLAIAVRNAQTALRAGITTLRDCGGMRDTTLALRRAQRLGYAVAPRLHLCRCPITITGGHCWYFGGEADGPEGMRRMVRGLVKSGVDYVKIMGSGGGTVGTIAWRPSYTVEELRAAVDEAHRLGRRVGIHCTCADATRNAVAAGADHIEHAMFLKDEAGHHQFEPDVADAVARRGTPVTATLSVSHYLLAAMAQRAHDAAADGVLVERFRRMATTNLENVRRMRQAGVRYVAGTDAGWRYTPFDGLATEMALLQQAGASAGEAIVAATSAAAEALGIAAETGALREGLQADMIAVSGDPLSDLSVLRHPAMVMLGGRVVARSQRPPT